MDMKLPQNLQNVGKTFSSAAVKTSAKVGKFKGKVVKFFEGLNLPDYVKKLNSVGIDNIGKQDQTATKKNNLDEHIEKLIEGASEGNEVTDFVKAVRKHIQQPKPTEQQRIEQNKKPLPAIPSQKQNITEPEGKGKAKGPSQKKTESLTSDKEGSTPQLVQKSGQIKVRTAEPVKVTKLDVLEVELKNRFSKYILVAIEIKAFAEEKILKKPEKAAETKLKRQLFFIKSNKLLAFKIFGKDFISTSANLGKNAAVYNIAASALKMDPNALMKESLKGICAGECLICAKDILHSSNLEEDQDYEINLVGITSKFAKGSDESAVIAQHKYLAEGSKIETESAVIERTEELKKRNEEIDNLSGDFEKINKINELVDEIVEYTVNKDVMSVRRIIEEEGMDLTKAQTFKDINQLTGKDGVYRVSLVWVDKGADHLSGHDVLFIKKGGQMHLFDPNFGLIRCNAENPNDTLKNLFSLYLGDPEKPRVDGIHISISEYVKK